MARKREPPRSPRQKKATSGASGPSAEQDHGYVKMRAQLVQLGLQLREIPGDGNCLFRALADQLTGCAGDHKIHRRETVDFIVQHRDEFEPFVEDDVPFDRHVASLVDEGTYAGNDSIVAFARNHGVTVVIHQLEAPLWQIPGDPDNVADAPQLHIAYHDGEHYNSVRRMGDLGQGPANVYINLEAPAQPSASCTSAEEREVMSRARCTDLTQVRRALNDCAGDVDAASEFLLALNTWEQDVTDAPPSPSSPHQLTKAAAAATAAKMRNDKNAGQVVSGRLERRQRRTEERDRRRRRKGGAEPGDQLLSSSPPAAVGHLAALTI